MGEVFSINFINFTLIDYLKVNEILYKEYRKIFFQKI